MSVWRTYADKVVGAQSGCVGWSKEAAEGGQQRIVGEYAIHRTYGAPKARDLIFEGVRENPRNFVVELPTDWHE
ncbi:hypothetical protein C5615_37480 [Burkholderia cepacia]|uniref:Uncharacterized protein n=1 Tax=Burkholderia cepacia TaxID=292 RepID=A0A2S8HYN5_BURCE|nr:hypothetical protein C5615_37480 [Burkholderia cepacia]